MHQSIQSFKSPSPTGHPPRIWTLEDRFAEPFTSRGQNHVHMLNVRTRFDGQFYYFIVKRQNQRPWLSIHRLSLDIVDLFFWAICSQRWSLRLKTPPCWKIPAQIPHPLGTDDSQMLRERGEGVLKLRIDQRNIRFPFFIRGGFHTLDDRYHDHARELHLISSQIRSHWFPRFDFVKLVGLAGSRFLVTNKQSRKHEDIPQCALTLPEKQQKLMCT